tara:strand:- start:11756 stop:11980 length:225 start_codon:yes stop_codon:yes gene_type:complete
MSDKKAAAAPVPELVPPVDPRVEQQQRAAACGAEIERVLNDYNCKIQTFFNPAETVGDGSKMMVSASFGVFPLA